MRLPNLLSYVQGHGRKAAAQLVGRNVITVDADPPLISFTFDDFLRSGLYEGGDILNRRGFAGTYYVALGLAGQNGIEGPMFEMEDLPLVVRHGHELGCHTFGHCDSWRTASRQYESSVMENRRKMKELLPDVEFRSFSYPFCSPHPMNKYRVAPHFLSCRAGYQGLNAGATDLNQLDAFFLEKTRGDLGTVREIVDLNCRKRGWLIFATHDICHSPTPWGCTPGFFEQVVKYAAQSGARILPVAEAVEALVPATSRAASQVPVG